MSKKKPLTERTWETCKDSTAMLECLQGKASERKLRLFAVACCRPLLKPKQWEHEALDIAEEVAEGKPKRALRKEWEGWQTWLMEDDSPLHWALHFALDPDLQKTGLDADFTEWVADLCPDSKNQSYLIGSGARLRSGSKKRPDLARQADLLRCIFSNPFQPVAFAASWRPRAVTTLARSIYEEQRFQDLPILADALEERGCDNQEVLGHCRAGGEHVRGCWVLDLVLGKD